MGRNTNSCLFSVNQDVNHKLLEDNKELRNLCCFLDDDRQKGKRLSREWQRLGRFSASVMRKEVAIYLQKAKELEQRQMEVTGENLELKEVFLMLAEERAAATDGGRCRGGVGCQGDPGCRNSIDSQSSVSHLAVGGPAYSLLRDVGDGSSTSSTGSTDSPDNPHHKQPFLSSGASPGSASKYVSLERYRNSCKSPGRRHSLSMEYHTFPQSCCTSGRSLTKLNPHGIQGPSPEKHKSPVRLQCDPHPKACSSDPQVQKQFLMSAGGDKDMAKSSPKMSQRQWQGHRAGVDCNGPEGKQASMGTPERLRKERVIVGCPESIRHHHQHGPGTERDKGRYSRERGTRRPVGEETSPQHQSLYNGRHTVTPVF